MLQCLMEVFIYSLSLSLWLFSWQFPLLFPSSSATVLLPDDCWKMNEVVWTFLRKSTFGMCPLREGFFFLCQKIRMLVQQKYSLDTPLVVSFSSPSTGEGILAPSNMSSCWMCQQLYCSVFIQQKKHFLETFGIPIFCFP